MISNSFIEPTLNYHSVDTFQIRNAIFESIRSNIPYFNGNLLDVGCGKMPYKRYILDNSLVTHYLGLDIEGAIEYDSKIKPDVVWDGIKMPIASESYDTVIATEVLEHCFEPEVLLKESYRVLKPNGYFFFTVPFLWNLHETPNDAYRYTPYAIKRHLNNVGFRDIKLEATGGWHASMAQMLGLWVKRSAMASKKRKLLSYFALKVIPYLIKLDKKRDTKFKEGQMITGLYGTARK